MTFGEVCMAIIIAFVLAIFSIVAIVWLIGRIATRKVRRIRNDVIDTRDAIKGAWHAVGNAGKSVKGLIKKK